VEKKTAAAAAPSFKQRLHLASVASVEAGLLREKMTALLSEQEQAELTSLLDLYKGGACSVTALANTLLQLLGSEAKLELLTEVRRAVRLPDIEEFDHLVSQAEFTALKWRTLRRKRQGADVPDKAAVAWDAGMGSGQSSSDAPLRLGGVTSEGVSSDPQALPLRLGGVTGEGVSSDPQALPLRLGGVTDEGVSSDPQPSSALSGSPLAAARNSSGGSSSIRGVSSSNDGLTRDELLARLATSPSTARQLSPLSQRQGQSRQVLQRSPHTGRSPLGGGGIAEPVSPSPDLTFLDDMLALAEHQGRASQQKANSHIFRRRAAPQHSPSSLNRVSCG